MKERITVLLGAGAMIESTGVSTKSLTEKVICECKEYKINENSDESVVDLICKKFLYLYNKENFLLSNDSDKIHEIISFEDIFHVLELLPNYADLSGHKGYTSAFKVFSELNKEFKDINMRSIYKSAEKIIDLINNEINNYDSEFKSKGNLFEKFFLDISNSEDYAFDVFNLNYDTWVEQSLKTYNDGYVDIEGYKDEMKRFDVGEYIKEDDRHTVAHLHGQICFGYPKFKIQDINRYAFKEDINTLYKYNNFNFAEKYRLESWNSDDSTQSGENLFRTNIITGLMKTDKLLWNPLNVYQNKFMNSLLKNKRLIIIGYGFSDIYINRLLYQYNSVHFDDRKIIMIDYINKDNWHSGTEHPFKPSEKALFTNIVNKDDFWCRKSPNKPKKDLLISEDNMVCIGISGFNDVCKNQITKIKEFLKK